MKKYIKLVLALVFITICQHNITAQDFATKEKPFYLYNYFQGTNRVLTYTGENQPVIMAKKEKGNTAQMWYIETVEGTVFPKFKNIAAGPNQCLDVVDEKIAEYNGLSRVVMAGCGNYSGQLWDMKVTLDGLQLSTQFQGTERLLDCDGLIDGSIVGLMDKANVSGQTWNIDPVNPIDEKAEAEKEAAVAIKEWNSKPNVELYAVIKVNSNGSCEKQRTLVNSGKFPEGAKLIWYKNGKKDSEFKILGYNEYGAYYVKDYVSCNNTSQTTHNWGSSWVLEVQNNKGEILGKQSKLKDIMTYKYPDKN